MQRSPNYSPSISNPSLGTQTEAAASSSNNQLSRPSSSSYARSSPIPPAQHGTVSEQSPPSVCQLPTKGHQDDAKSAIEKLERISRQKKPKNKLRKGGGLNAIRSSSSKRRRNHGSFSDSDDSSSSSIHIGKAYGEVKLMISSLPDHPVVGRVRNAASRAKDRLGRGDFESPQGSPGFDGMSKGMSGSRRRMPTGKRVSTRSWSKNHEPGNAGAPPSFDSGAPLSRLGSTTESVLLESSLQRLSSQDSPLPRRGSLVQNPELLVVDEEGRAQAPESNLAKPSASRYFLGTPSDLSPSESAISTPAPSPSMETTFNPLANIFASSSSFIAPGEPLSEEPESADLNFLNRTLSASPTRSSSSGNETDDDEDPNSSGIGSEEDNIGDALESALQSSLNLEHGEPTSKDELKRRRKLLRRAKRREGTSIPSSNLPSHPHHHGRAGQIGHQVSKGLQYASSQSRNRRAMERYSPNPNRLSQVAAQEATGSRFAGGTVPGALGSPVSMTSPVAWGEDGLSRSRASSPADHGRFAGSATSHPSMPALAASSSAGDGLDRVMTSESLTQGLKRWNTGNLSISSSKGSFKHYLNAPKMLRLHKQKKWESELAALEDSGGSTPREQQDPEKELDKVLGKLAIQEAPEQTKERYEFDVLYENQRGLLVFGIPKFSPRTLFQWDPSPWTDIRNQNSTYNVANAQLPDPSWEWVYPEWLIDMSGDTDQAGWQYSGAFSRRFWPRVPFPGKVGLPRAGAKGAIEMNARLEKKAAKRREKESTREDEGLEALKRTARARSAKWQGTPDAWTFVRRRRWIRLRRRRAIQIGGDSTKDNARRGKIPLASGATVEAGAPTQDLAEVQSTESELSSSLSSSEEDGTDSSTEYAPANSRPSAFLPRRLPGGFENGHDPLKLRDKAKAERMRRRAKEFTGTMRELKSLLPAILSPEKDSKNHRGSSLASPRSESAKFNALKLDKVDARNPFISWRIVKSRLEQDDMAFASASLRARERRYHQRCAAARAHRMGKEERTKRQMPQGYMNSRGEEKTSPDPSEGDPMQRSQEGKELTRDALIEINSRRVIRVLRACKLDRQKFDLWKVWLGVESLDSATESLRKEDLKDMGLLGGNSISGGTSYRYAARAEKARAKWRAASSLPDPLDVWDVLERRLDSMLMLFEFQSSRVTLIRLLLAIHDISHSEHKYQNNSHRSAPYELSPKHFHGSPQEMGGGSGSGIANEAWKTAGLPRLEFFSDLRQVLYNMPGTSKLETDEVMVISPSLLCIAPPRLNAGLRNHSAEALVSPPSRTGSPSILSRRNSGNRNRSSTLSAQQVNSGAFIRSDSTPSNLSPPALRALSSFQPVRNSSLVPSVGVTSFASSAFQQARQQNHRYSQVSVPKFTNGTLRERQVSFVGLKKDVGPSIEFLNDINGGTSDLGHADVGRRRGEGEDQDSPASFAEMMGRSKSVPLEFVRRGGQGV
ncbi:hypothetical protein IE53DRAFT_97420 [Violaceomyces palustris]|uniref:Uncharacterized protein n=1 Tax=Violaceomyces palustris TaxID=1673888 RepID=A0ACD0NX01_9BASI|nr:hypothetical protein IE53DRAFT_97420 [Violaceomyces palustris]